MPTPQEVLAELQAALACATDNLADCADMPPDVMAEIMQDHAALEHLCGLDATGQPRILGYL